MALLVFDTFDFIENLKGAGFDEKQAKALAQELKQVQLQHVATKEDVALLREDMHSLREEMAALKVELRAELAGSVTEAKLSLMKWMTGALFAQAGLIVALLRLF